MIHTVFHATRRIHLISLSIVLIFSFDTFFYVHAARLLGTELIP